MQRGVKLSDCLTAGAAQHPDHGGVRFSRTHHADAIDFAACQCSRRHALQAKEHLPAAFALRTKRPLYTVLDSCGELKLAQTELSTDQIGISCPLQNRLPCTAGGDDAFIHARLGEHTLATPT
jgi:hypothetical protein